MDDRTLIEPMDRTLVEGVDDGQGRRIEGWLTVWSGFMKGRDFPLFVGRNFVGGDKKCEICFPDIQFPSFFFNIRIVEGQWTVIDLDSDSGIIVNENATFRTELKDEDWIKAGNTVFRIKKR